MTVTSMSPPIHLSIIPSFRPTSQPAFHPSVRLRPCVHASVHSFIHSSIKLILSTIQCPLLGYTYIEVRFSLPLTICRSLSFFSLSLTLLLSFFVSPLHLRYMPQLVINQLDERL